MLHIRLCYLVAVLGSILWLSACEQPGTDSSAEDAGLQVANRVSLFESKGSQKQWLLTAEAVDFADLTSATLKNPELLLKQNGQDSARVQGDSGSFDYTNKLITVEGDARVESLGAKVVITTERFFYDINKDLIWSDQKTTILRGTAKSVAHEGIETDSKLTKIVLKKHTTRLPQDSQELKK